MNAPASRAWSLKSQSPTHSLKRTRLRDNQMGDLTIRRKIFHLPSSLPLERMAVPALSSRAICELGSSNKRSSCAMRSARNYGRGESIVKRAVALPIEQSSGHRALVCTATSTSTAGPGDGTSGLGGLLTLQSAKRVDRLRYQARMVFEYLYGSIDAKLGTAELEQYRHYVVERFGPLPEVLAPYFAAQSRLAGRGNVKAELHLGFEDFVDLLRQQVAAVSTPSSTFLEAAALPANESSEALADAAAAAGGTSAAEGAALSSSFSAGDATVEGDTAAKKAVNERRVRGAAAAGKLRFQYSLTAPELATALAVFKLLDFNNDGYLAVAEYGQRARGLEQEFFQAKLADADENEDGFLSRDDFLSSYAKKRAVFLNMAIMAAHTACIWFIFNIEGLNVMLKAVICAAILYKPQIITNPVTKLYGIFQTLYDRSRVALERGQRPEGSYRPASG